jgi:hypothetical protein
LGIKLRGRLQRGERRMNSALRLGVGVLGQFTKPLLTCERCGHDEFRLQGGPRVEAGHPVQLECMRCGTATSTPK